MKIYKKCFVGLVALLPLFSLGVVTSKANAQQSYSNANTLRIDGFNVDSVKRLDPGTDLNFSIYGTPGGTATLLIAGARRSITLSEVDVGQYDGSYTISTRDTITPQSTVTANLRLGNQVVSAVLRESLLTGVGHQAFGQHAGSQTKGVLPEIARFDVQSSADLSTGNELAFTLVGTPGGQAEVQIKGVKGKLFLHEVRKGEYAGFYTIKRRDRIAPNSVATANLRIGDLTAAATLGKSLQTAAAPAQRQYRSCAACGSVEAVNAVEVAGNGGYLGTIGGGVIGALLGNQVGGGSGKTAATIAGALGGAYAGHTLEGNANTKVHYEVLVRLENGGTQTVSFETDPGLRVGDKVRIAGGGLVRDL